MKKILLIALALIVTLAPACGGKKPGTGADRVLVTSTSTGITITFVVTRTPGGNVSVTETCSAGCDTLTPALKAGGTLKWHVTFTGFDGTGASATIDNFQKVTLDLGGVYDTRTANPFSGVPSPASFGFTPVDMDKSATTATPGAYKYSLTVKWMEGGNTITTVLDPRVIFDM